MADVTLNVQQGTQVGVAPSFTALNAVDTYFARNDGRQLFYFKNTNVSAAVITLITPKVVAGLAVGDQVINVPATNGEVVVAALNRGAFNDSKDDLSFTNSLATGVSVAALRV